MRFAEFLIFLVADEGVGDVTERALDRLLVGEEELFALGFGESDVGTNAARGEDGL